MEALEAREEAISGDRGLEAEDCDVGREDAPSDA